MHAVHGVAIAVPTAPPAAPTAPTAALATSTTPPTPAGSSSGTGEGLHWRWGCRHGDLRSSAHRGSITLPSLSPPAPASAATVSAPLSCAFHGRSAALRVHTIRAFARCVCVCVRPVCAAAEPASRTQGTRCRDASAFSYNLPSSPILVSRRREPRREARGRSTRNRNGDPGSGAGEAQRDEVAEAGRRHGVRSSGAAHQRTGNREPGPGKRGGQGPWTWGWKCALLEPRG